MSEFNRQLSLRLEHVDKLPATLMFDAPTAAAIISELASDLGSIPVPVADKNEAPVVTTEAGNNHEDRYTTSVERNDHRLFNPQTVSISPMMFILCPPRSGSTLLQLYLSVHPGLYAPQELHLMQFDSMSERNTALSGTVLAHGLTKCVQELQDCSLLAAERIVRSWATWSVLDVYRQIQAWCHPRRLVDNSPTYAGDINILHRSIECCIDAKFVHLVRHPYSCIRSGVEHADRMLQSADAGKAKVNWGSVEDVYTDSHENIDDFFQLLPPDQTSIVAYEDLVGNPETTLNLLCDAWGVSYEPAMSQPYGNSTALSSFQGSHGITIGDPKHLKQRQINHSAAESWRKVAVPQPLRLSTVLLARKLGYTVDSRFPPELVCLYRSSCSDTAVFMVPDISGTLATLSKIGAQYGETNDVSVYGFRVSARFLHHSASVESIARHYETLIQRYFVSSGVKNVHLVGYSFGFSVAYLIGVWIQAAIKDIEIKIVSMDGPVCGAVEYDAGLETFLETLELSDDKLSIAEMLVNSHMSHCTSARCVSPIMYIQAPDPKPNAWMAEYNFEARPILHRGNEHASVLVYYVGAAQTTARFYAREFSTLDTVGHWYVEILTRERATLRAHLSVFSEKDSYIECPPDHTLTLRIHHWIDNAKEWHKVSLPRYNAKEWLKVSLPRFKRTSQDVRLLLPRFRLPTIWTADISSRLLFSMVRDEFCYPDQAPPLLRRIFLPVENKCLAYFYLTCDPWSEVLLDLGAPGTVHVYLTYYDRCGHPMHGECLKCSGAVQHYRIPMTIEGCVVLGRVIPRGPKDLDSLAKNATITLTSTSGALHGPIALHKLNRFEWTHTLRERYMDSSLARKRLRSVFLYVLHRQAQKANPYDDRVVDNLRHIANNVCVVKRPSGVTHYSIYEDTADLTAIFSTFFKGDRTQERFADVALKPVADDDALLAGEMSGRVPVDA